MNWFKSLLKVNGFLRPETAPEQEYKTAAVAAAPPIVEISRGIYSAVAGESLAFCRSYEMRAVPGTRFKLRELVIVLPADQAARQATYNRSPSNFKKTIYAEIKKYSETHDVLVIDEASTVTVLLDNAAQADTDCVWSSDQVEVEEGSNRFIATVKFKGEFDERNLSAAPQGEQATQTDLHLWLEVGGLKQHITHLPVTIGREADFVVNTADISRQHAHIEPSASGPCLRNNSAQGKTLLNGVDLPPGVQMPLGNLSAGGVIVLIGSNGSQVKLHYQLQVPAHSADGSARARVSVPTQMMSAPTRTTNATSGNTPTPAPSVSESQSSLASVVHNIPPESDNSSASPKIWRLQYRTGGASEWLDFVQGSAQLPAGLGLSFKQLRADPQTGFALIQTQGGELYSAIGQNMPSIFDWRAGESYWLGPSGAGDTSAPSVCLAYA